MTSPIDAPLAALAILLLEVMDKEPPLAQRAAVYGVFALVGILLARKRWWLGLSVLPLVALFGLADVSELRDPYVVPAIIQEAGLLHVVAWYALIFLALAIPSVAAVIERRRKSP